MKGRKPSTEPAQAYQYRRCLALVQVLAIDDFQKRNDAMNFLRETWLGDRGHFILYDSPITALAKHALEAARANVDATNDKM